MKKRKAVYLSCASEDEGKERNMENRQNSKSNIFGLNIPVLARD